MFQNSCTFMMTSNKCKYLKNMFIFNQKTLWLQLEVLCLQDHCKHSQLNNTKIYNTKIIKFSLAIHSEVTTGHY